MGQTLKARGNTTLMLSLYRLELACAHKFLACEGVYMQSEGATALKGRLQKGIDIPIDMSKSMEGKCLFDKHEIYVCVCVLGQVLLACLALVY